MYGHNITLKILFGLIHLCNFYTKRLA